VANSTVANCSSYVIRKCLIPVGNTMVFYLIISAL